VRYVPRLGVLQRGGIGEPISFVTKTGLVTISDVEETARGTT
jgi:hypothetical protein